MRNEAQRSCDAELTCVNNGGVYDALNNACTLGDVVYSDAAVCEWSTSGPGASGGGGSNWLSGLSSFDFGVVSNAYCNLAPLFSGGNVPQGCQQQTSPDGSPIGSQPQDNSKRYILAIVLIVAVAVISFFVIRKLAKRK